MSYVFYDTETTGISKSFDQILQFAAIRTDDDLQELDRFNIRCQLLPHIVPSPQALRITRVTPAMLTDASLPSHYEMMGQIHQQLRSWSPATFVGFNSIAFDEELQRQAFFQTLHLPYLTNTNGNVRSDVLLLARAASIYAPKALKVPLGDMGRPTFQLSPLARENGYRDPVAHEALADVLSTVYLARLIRDRAPAVWEAMARATTRSSVTEYVRGHPIFTLTGFHAGRAYSSLVTGCGQNPERKAELAVFDLSFNPNDYVSLSVDDLVRVLGTKSRPLRSLPANRQPTLMPEDAAPSGTNALDVPPGERRRRMELVRANRDFQVRVGQALAQRGSVDPPSSYVEQRIYDGFPAHEDTARMEEFHHVPWDERVAIASTIEDPRIQELAHRLIYFERSDVLPATTVAELRDWVSKRVLAEGDDVPWTTVNKAIRETEALLQDAAGPDAELLREAHFFLRDFAGR